jgi:hypothetical protein
MTAFAGRAPGRHPQTPNAACTSFPNIWPQASEAPIQHHRLKWLPNPRSLQQANPPKLPNTDTMAPKQRTPATTGAPQTTTSTPARPSKSTGSDAQDILQGIYNKYVQKTPQRVKLLDTFRTFLLVVGALQFFYVVLVGNFVRIPASHTTVPGETQTKHADQSVRDLMKLSIWLFASTRLSYIWKLLNWSRPNPLRARHNDHPFQLSPQ